MDSQQAIALGALRRAAGDPVSYAELRDAGIEFPASVVSELELAGVAIRRCYGSTGGKRSVGVRLERSRDWSPAGSGLGTAPSEARAIPGPGREGVRVYGTSACRALLRGALTWVLQHRDRLSRVRQTQARHAFRLGSRGESHGSRERAAAATGRARAATAPRSSRARDERAKHRWVAPVALAGVTITICAIALGALLGPGAYSTGLRPRRARNETAAAGPAARLPAHPAALLSTNPPPHHVAPAPPTPTVTAERRTQTPTAPTMATTPQTQTQTQTPPAMVTEPQTPTAPTVATAPQTQTPATPTAATAPQTQTHATTTMATEPEAQGSATPTVATEPQAQGPATPTVATMLEAQGHDLLQAGSYAEAVPVLRRAVSATGERLSECLQPATPTCLTYAYALYDLGQALRLEGQPAAAVPILQGRLEINNQRSAVQAALQLARQTTR